METKTVALNRKARFDYQIEDKIEAGIKLTGAESQSVRRGAVNLSGSYVKIMGDDALLIGAQISPYPYAADKDYDPERTRKLLLHRREIERLRGLADRKGVTLVPLRVFLRRGLAKLEVGIGRGRKKWDKREVKRRKSVEREVERAVKERRSSGSDTINRG